LRQILGEGHEFLETFHCSTGVESFDRQRDSFTDRGSAIGGVDTRTGVEYYRVAAWARFPCKYAERNAHVVFHATAGKCPDRGLLQSERVWNDFVGDHVAAASVVFGDERWPGQSKLVKSLSRMDEDCVLASKSCQGLGELASDPVMADADQLMTCPGRIGQWSQDIEDGSNPDLSPRRPDEPHRGVERWGVHEANAHGVDTASHVIGRQLNRYSQTF